jgi:hypothetical protein
MASTTEMTAAEMAAATTMAATTTMPATTVTSASTAAVTSAATSTDRGTRQQRRQNKDCNSDRRFGHGTLLRHAAGAAALERRRWEA